MVSNYPSVNESTVKMMGCITLSQREEGKSLVYRNGVESSAKLEMSPVGGFPCTRSSNLITANHPLSYPLEKLGCCSMLSAELSL